MSVGLLPPVAPGDLLWGSTALLGVGAVAAGLGRAPAQSQRAAELAVAGTLIWLLLALVPLPRWPQRSTETQTVAIAEPVWTVIEVGEPAIPGGGAAAPGSARTDRVAQEASEGPSSAAGPGPIHNVTLPEEGDGRAPSIGRLSWTAYGVGSAFAAVYLLLGAVLVYRLLSRSEPAPSWLDTLFAARCKVMGVRRARLRVSNSQCRPLLAGIFMPTVIIPRVLVQPERNADLCRAFDHELVHVRRGDVWSRALFALGALVIWPHPLFWYIRARAALSAELIADDAAAGVAGRRDYARGLLALADELHARRLLSEIVPGAFRNRSELTRRIEMLTRDHMRFAMKCAPKLRALQAGATLLIVGACTAFFGARTLPGQEASPGRDSTRSETARNIVVTPELQALLQQDSDPAHAYASTLTLVDRVVMLQGEVELARAELAEGERRYETGVIRAAELTQMRLNLTTLQRRLDAALILVQSEIETTQIELAHIENLLESPGFTALESPRVARWEMQQIRLAARLKVLQSLL